MIKKSTVMMIFLQGCSPQAAQQDSCGKTLISDDVSVTPGIEKSFYWGYAELNYDPELAGLIFAQNSSKIKKIKDNATKFRCRVLYVPNGEFLDAWSSRHCLMTAAVTNLDLFYFDDAGNRQKLDFDLSAFQGWGQVANIIKSLSQVESIYSTQFLDNFVEKNLYFNAFNSKIFDQAEEDLEITRFVVREDEKLPRRPRGEYFTNLFQQSNADQQAEIRDLCATDFSSEIIDKKTQNICFSITDLSLTRVPKPKGLQIKDFNKKHYEAWADAQLGLESATTRFILEEFSYKLADFCKSTNKQRKECAISNEINMLIAAGKHFKRFGTDSAALSKIFDAVESTSSSVYSKNRILLQYDHLDNLVKEFENVGKVFAEVKKEYVKADSRISLAGMFTKKDKGESLLGLISFNDAFENTNSRLVLRTDGLYLATNSSKVIFEKQDSGSILLSQGFPLASLSTVNGEASAGGASSLGRTNVAQIQDIVDPAIIGGSSKDDDILAKVDVETEASKQPKPEQKIAKVDHKTGASDIESDSSQEISQIDSGGEIQQVANDAGIQPDNTPHKGGINSDDSRASQQYNTSAEAIRGF